LKDYVEATIAQNKKIDPKKPGTTAVIDHGITTRHVGYVFHVDEHVEQCCADTSDLHVLTRFVLVL
jgi:hypothetical protein